MPFVSSVKGDRFYFDLTKAALSPEVFDDPDSVNPHRNPASYLAFEGDGMFNSGSEIVATIDDIVTFKTTQVPYKFVNEKGDLTDTNWMEEALVYKLQSGASEKDGEIPVERWAYLDPEIGRQT